MSVAAAVARPFSECPPTLAHRALVSLWRAGLVHLVVTQNVDGLHLRSGLARDSLTELHGDFFVESCERCGYQVPTLTVAFNFAIPALP